MNVLVTSTDKKDISEYGDPKAFLEQINYIFGDQVFIGEFVACCVQETAV